MKNKKIKILDITGSNPMKMGGVEQFLRSINKELIKRGFDITTICYSDKNKSTHTRIGKIIELKVPKNEAFRVLIYPFKILQQLKNYKADIIISEGLSAYGGGLIISLFSKNRSVHIERAHGTHQGLINYTPKKSLHMMILGRLLASIVERNAFRMADYSIAVSKVAAEELKTYFGVDAKKIKIIYNGVDTKKFKPVSMHKKVELRKKLGIERWKKCGIWIGGTDPYRKGLDIVIETAATLKEVEFRIVGVNINEGKDFIEKYNKKTNLDNVKFLSKLSDKEKINEYQASDFLIFPSRHEGMAVVPMEALACGLPVIISKMTGVNEIITNWQDGIIINNFNFIKYAKAVEKLLNNKVLYKNISRNSRKTALNYNWESVGKEYCKFLKSLIKKEIIKCIKIPKVIK